MSLHKPTATGSAGLRPGPVASRPKPDRSPALPTAAFTLIELLTVIVIIGILAAIIIPVAGRVRDSARTAKCVSNWRQLGAAFSGYAADNKDKFPYTAWRSGVPASEQYWHQVAPYMTKVPPMPWNTPQTDSIRKFMTQDMGCIATPNRWWHGVSDKISQRPLSTLTHPSRTILGIDIRGSSDDNMNIWLDNNTVANNSQTQRLKRFTPKPHASKVNVLYVDGHVRTLHVSQIMLGDYLRATPDYNGSDDTTPVGDPAYDK
ncbi:prepilin-type N-terminal cleavage/methylation domain-containing protein [Opitutaceae bacterium TAV1]|nr:prepilin-type N-terminal cleavage/methylation domain-containing protein [Opitutaceae bacterium TAV1]